MEVVWDVGMWDNQGMGVDRDGTDWRARGWSGMMWLGMMDSGVCGHGQRGWVSPAFATWAVLFYYIVQSSILVLV